MNIWLIKDGENLPIQTDARKMRTWMLAEELQKRGHEVTWWASTHSHQRKNLLFREDREIEVATGFRLKLLFAGSYRSNRSLGRLLHHARLAAKFRRQAPAFPAPDVIVSSYPTIELAYEAVAFGRPRGIPVIIDIRDPWPDILLDLAPPALRAAARLALLPLERKARAALAGADSLVACSQGFLDWGLRKAGLARRAADKVFYLGRARHPSNDAADSPAIAELGQKLAGKVIFCFVGSFGHVYELDLVCDAAALLERKGDRRIHFVLAGDGPQYGAVRARAKTLGNVTAPGWLSASDADRLLALADVGMAPYRQMAGALPNKVFDYSAAGLPILSSLEGEMTEMLANHRAGLSYAPGDVGAFTAHVSTLAESARLREELALGSAAMFEREFLAASIYPEYVCHVESIARARAH